MLHFQRKQTNTSNTNYYVYVLDENLDNFFSVAFNQLKGE